MRTHLESHCVHNTALTSYTVRQSVRVQSVSVLCRFYSCTLPVPWRTYGHFVVFTKHLVVFTNALSFLRKPPVVLRTLWSFCKHQLLFTNTLSFSFTSTFSFLRVPCRFVVLYYGHLDVFRSARLVEFFRTPCRLYECLVVCTSASSFLRTPCCFSEHPVVVTSNMWFLWVLIFSVIFVRTLSFESCRFYRQKGHVVIFFLFRFFRALSLLQASTSCCVLWVTCRFNEGPVVFNVCWSLSVLISGKYKKEAFVLLTSSSNFTTSVLP